MAADPGDHDRLLNFNALCGFRGLWFTRRPDRKVCWTVTYLEGGEFWETDEWPTWREAMDDFIRRMGLDHEVTICAPPTSDDGGTVKLRAIVAEYTDIVENTQGVVGWHLNGDMAEWDEFEEAYAIRHGDTDAPAPPPRDDEETG